MTITDAYAGEGRGEKIEKKEGEKITKLTKIAIMPFTNGSILIQ